MNLDGGRSIIAMPYTQQLNDKSAIEKRFVSADGFRQMICDQFDVLYREGAKSGRVMAIALHPYLIGVPHRIGALDEALKYICKHKKVWKATGSEIARHYVAQRKDGGSAKRKPAKKNSRRGAMTMLYRGAPALLLGVTLLLSPLRLRARRTMSRSGRSARPRPISGRSTSASRRAFSPPRRSSSTWSSSSRARTWCSSSPPARSTSRMSTGLVDPIRAIDKGAPIAIVRFEMQAPPYALLAKSSIKSLKELKGKTISLGGPKDITKIFVERMLAPHGVKPGEFDMVFAGATSARASALQAGAVDAAILLPPFNFHAEAAGFNNLGLTVDYAPELPFSGAVVNRNWAAKNQALLQRLLAAHKKSVEWFYDAKNRDEAITIMATVSQHQARGRREVLRLPAQGQLLRAHRHGVAEEAGRAARGPAAARRPAGSPTSNASCCPAPRR